MNLSEIRGATFLPDVLATDLDGTLIPLDDSHIASLKELSQQLVRHQRTLVYVTGRDPGLTREAMSQYELPRPQWIICDVGSSILTRIGEEDYEHVTSYNEHLESLCHKMPLQQLREQLKLWPELTLQEETKQGLFKLSFYSKASVMPMLEEKLSQWLVEHKAPYTSICSIDPFTNDGLVDLLPRGVSKAYALEWWRTLADRSADEIVFAGDSGNDYAALTAGYLAVVVGNAHRDVIERVTAAHRQRNCLERLHVAESDSTTGVLEGCRQFGLIPDD